jgi:hypothetical protein
VISKSNYDVPAAYHTVKYRQVYISVDCTSVLFKIMLTDYKKAQQFFSAGTRKEANVKYVIEPHFVKAALQSFEGNNTVCCGVAIR